MSLVDEIFAKMMDAGMGEAQTVVCMEDADMVVASSQRIAFRYEIIEHESSNRYYWVEIEIGKNAAGTTVRVKHNSTAITKPAWVPYSDADLG